MTRFARSLPHSEHPSTQRSELPHNSSHNSSVELIMGLRLSIVGGALVAKSARALLRPPAVARRAITTKRTDWAGEARSVCQGATEDKLEALGYALPPASTPKGSYAMYSRAGDTLYLAGHIPVRPDGSICTGVVGKDLKKSQGTDAARLCGLAILRTLSDAVGLDNVKKVHNCVEINQCVASMAWRTTP